jgi:beta-glucosidase/6-phospho-beta-glucosidase/beta-galactosidase
MADFLWGVATASYQSEGGYNGPGQPRNNWARVENERDVARTGRAADFWVRWPEDLERCAAMGLNAFRMGIDWTRVEPERDRFDVDALAKYAEIIGACMEKGLEPVVTLHHFTHPEWAGVDAWLRPATAPLFERFVKTAVAFVNSRLPRPVAWWITVNEPNMLVLNTYVGRQFPGKARIGFRTVVQAYNGLLAGHVLAYNAIHDLYERSGWPAPNVTLNNFCADLYLSDKVVLDLLSLAERGIPREGVDAHLREKSAEFARELTAARIPLRRDLPYWCGAVFKWISLKAGERWLRAENLGPLLDAVYASPRKRLLDVIALDYYDPFTAHAFRVPVWWDHEFKNKSFRSWVINSITSKWWDWKALPRGLRFFCEYYARDFGGRPLIIAENGMALRRRPDNRHTPRRDRLTRSEFLRMHLREVMEIARDGIPLAGYLHWSLTDNFEWGTFTPRFGLFSLDYTKGTDRLAEDHHGDRPSETYAALVREARDQAAARRNDV